MSDTIIVIPSRLAATRLPNKPLADILGKPMIQHVYEKAVAANVGRVVVAATEQELYDKLVSLGIDTVHVPDDVPTGTDRVFKALVNLNVKPKYVINLQGDIPTISSSAIVTLVNRIREDDVDIATLANETHDEFQKSDINSVKVVIGNKKRAIYFTRAAGVPYGEGPLYHHIGIYAFTYDALEKFISLRQSKLELRERLEQLRALENGLNIGIELVDENPHGVDTEADLLLVRNQMECDRLIVNQ